MVAFPPYLGVHKASNLPGRGTLTLSTDSDMKDSGFGDSARRSFSVGTTTSMYLDIRQVLLALIQQEHGSSKVLVLRRSTDARSRTLIIGRVESDGQGVRNSALRQLRAG